MVSSANLPAAKSGTLADAVLAVACGLGLAIALFAVLILPLSPQSGGHRDFIMYWAAGHQFARHANPWDPVAIGRLEHSAGFPSPIPYYVRNPPWALPLTLPLGLLPSRVAGLPWALFMAAVLVLSIHILWTVTGRPRSPLDWLAYCFPPSLICVAMGQFGLFLLLGLVLFLRLEPTRPFFAGAALWFCSLKPHLFLPFAVVLLLFILVHRRYRIVLGALAALALSAAVTTAFDPHAWTQYLAWARASHVPAESMPCLGVLLRDLISPAATWLTFLPAIAGCLWAAVWFWPRRRSWNWTRHADLLVLVSLLVAPYCWISDQCLAIPALIAAARRSSSPSVLALLGLLCLGIEAQLFFAPKFSSFWYFWPAPAWLLWYLCAHASARIQAPVPGDVDRSRDSR